MKHFLLTLMVFGSFGAFADDAGLTWDEIFQKHKDKFITLRCSGESKTTMSWVGLEIEPNIEMGTFSVYYYLNEDYLYRRLSGSLEALGHSSLIYGWEPIPFHSDVWVNEDSISFNTNYPKEYLDKNPLPGIDSNTMEQVSEKHKTLIDRNTGDYKYTYFNSIKAAASKNVITREDVWTGNCEVITGKKKF